MRMMASHSSDDDEMDCIADSIGAAMDDGGSSCSDDIDNLDMTTVDGKMTALVNSQKSDGMFEIASDKWDDSVFYMYLGRHGNVKKACPEGIAFTYWLTTLAIKILETKMSEKKDLWELVAEKSKKCLINLLNNEEEYQRLQDTAEEYVKSIEK